MCVGVCVGEGVVCASVCVVCIWWEGGCTRGNNI